jgi:uncharacterized protein (TIGR02266 family)
MDDNAEKRRDPRVPLVLRVDWPDLELALHDVTENVSAAGLFIRTDRVLEPGARLPLHLGFPGLLDPIEIEVEVVWRRPDGPERSAGVAVKVPADRNADRARLERLAEAYRARMVRSARAYRVLVVEDNPHAAEMYEYALRKLRSEAGEPDVELEHAQNGHEAWRRLEREPRIDLVLSDLYMPVLDGFGLVEKMRASPRLASVPVLVISAGDDEARDRATAIGVDVFLQKPVQLVDVIQTVRALLRARGQAGA